MSFAKYPARQHFELNW